MGVKIDDDFTGDPDKDGSHPRSTSKSKRKSGKKKSSAAHPPSAASQLVELALERYRFGVSEDGEPYAVRPGHHVVRLLRGGTNSLRAELSKAFHQKYRKVPPQQALADALLVLEGTAQDQDPDQVYLRVAAADGSVWRRLGRPDHITVHTVTQSATSEEKRSRLSPNGTRALPPGKWIRRSTAGSGW